MNKKEELKRKIESGIQSFSKSEFYIASDGLLSIMGYSSDRQLPLRERSPQEFINIYDKNSKLNHQKALVENWLSIDLLFQLTGNDLNQGTQQSLPLLESDRIDQNITSYLFFALNLKDQNYSRTKLSDVTREINKLFSIPVMLVIKNGEKISVAIINRRPNKREPEKDVLEKVTLIKDVDIKNPHRAHIEILCDLSFIHISAKHTIQDMEALHKAWQTILDIKELNKKFYKELSCWYFWAVKECTFPIEAGDDETRNPTSVIRLITRLIFIWFIKEKGLVPDELFDKSYIINVLKTLDDYETTYYKAILQNLFFATLNQEDLHKRRFIYDNSYQGKNKQYGVLNIYRYKDLFTQPETELELFQNIPFLNGGLFECLDRDREENEPIPAGCEPDMRRVDGFSQNKDNTLSVPNELFFGLERQVDLNTIYGTKNKRYNVRGLINILQSYKFTIEENTPLEEEVALDPELLGRVFENLLAAYNPETQTTARKATGSYYTPREIVNYMVDESLLAYLSQNLVEVNPKPEIHALSSSQPTLAGEHQPGLPSENLYEMSTSPYENRLRRLFSYSEYNNPFNEEETRVLIDAIGNVKVLDPACGSGAFPMGILHRLVFLLGKLDEHNQRWKQRQLEKVYEIEDPQARETAVKAIEETFETNELNYGRKLYLIQNCIYGVDIQPIAGQIAKLRFFISLVVDQKVDDIKPNRGISSLPNLESKFVAANTLLSLEKPDSDEGHQMALGDDSIEKMKEDLIRVRNKHFSAHTRAQKIACRKKDRELRKKLAVELQKFGWSTSSAKQLADWNPYDQNASADFFDPVWMFGIEGGFDIVIANPPYVSVKGIKSNDKQNYKNSFETVKGRFNLFTLFLEKGNKILRQKGILTFIIPESLFSNVDYKYIRKYLIVVSNF